MSDSTKDAETPRISAHTELTEYQQAVVRFDANHDLSEVFEYADGRGWSPFKFAGDVLNALYNPGFTVWEARA